MDIDIIQKKIERVQRKVEGSCGSFFGSIGDAIFDTFFQTYILTKKNIILYWRRRWSTLLQICAPVFIILLLIILGVIINNANPETLNPDVVTVSSTNLIKCTPFGKNATWVGICYTYVYTTNNNSWGNQIMNQIISIYSLTNTDVLEVPFESDLVNFIKLNPNVTQLGISFSNVTKFFGRNSTTYTLYYNSTGDIPNVVPQTQMILDNVILQLAGSFIGKNFPFGVIKNGIMDLPSPPNRRDGQTIIFTQSGALFFSLSTMFILITTMYYVVLEKETRIRVGMMMMGLKNLSYWVSWFICAMIINILACLVTIVFGIICQISFFQNTNFFVLFLTFVTFGMSLIALAFLLSTFVKTAKAALILGFIVFSISFILNLFMTSGSVIYLLYKPGQFPYYIPFAFYPPYNFAKMFADIAIKSLKVYDSTTRTYVDGPGYAWGDFTQWNLSGTQSAPPSVDSMYLLWMNTAIFLAIGWYLDYVMPTSVHEKNPFFFLSPGFWGFPSCTPKRIALHEINVDDLDDDIKNEYHTAREKNEDLVLRVVGLGKVFGGILGKLGITKELIAVNDLSIHIKYGTCLALLGHNGAGKTTTISILVGLLKSDFGDAMINGKSVKYSMDEIRKTLGVCPQHDILWDELTAREHLQLFAEFKGVSRKDIPKEINSRLTDVDLLNVGNLCAGTFSGGMKRRLSVAISCIGDPDIIFLDEPTTGMDPHSRRKVWKLIEEIKSSRAILLTTHSMEEADALADRIAIMANGTLQCIGDSLHLKKKYGAGYNLNLVIKPEFEKDVKKLIKEKIPSFETVSSNAGSLIINVLPKFINELATLLEIIEENSEGPEDKKMIRDWGISHTNLEEVYLKVTSHEFNDFKDQEDKNTFEKKDEMIQQPTQIQTKQLLEMKDIPIEEKSPKSDPMEQPKEVKIVMDNTTQEQAPQQEPLKEEPKEEPQNVEIKQPKLEIEPDNFHKVQEVNE